MSELIARGEHLQQLVEYQRYETAMLLHTEMEEHMFKDVKLCLQNKNHIAADTEICLYTECKNPNSCWVEQWLL